MFGIAPHFWYVSGFSWPKFLLYPFSLVWIALMRGRRFLYKHGFLKVHYFHVPVMVVGNITVGGSGKTPTVIALVEHLRAKGWVPGVVSRGYGGRCDAYPLHLSSETQASESGDEPCLIFRRTQVPVVVDPDRVRAVRYLLDHSDCNIILSDDGLQHYALGRRWEIVVIDGERRFGNGACLPAGPLREPISRLQHVSFRWSKDGQPAHGEQLISTHYAETLLPLQGEGSKSLLLSEQVGMRFHAVSGIAYPERFFKALEQKGLKIIRHAFADHHTFIPDDFNFPEQYPIIMTEKDAVKCAFLKKEAYYWPIEVILPELIIDSEVKNA